MATRYRSEFDYHACLLCGRTYDLAWTAATPGACPRCATANARPATPALPALETLPLVDAAAWAGLTPGELDTAIAAGELAVCGTEPKTRRRLIARADLVAYLARRQAQRRPVVLPPTRPGGGRPGLARPWWEADDD